MCFGGGYIPPTPIIERKVDYGPLPSLSVKPIERSAPVMKDIAGKQPRSLLMPYTMDGK